jgi:hypothetical protein
VAELRPVKGEDFMRSVQFTCTFTALVPDDEPVSELCLDLDLETVSVFKIEDGKIQQVPAELEEHETVNVEAPDDSD